MTGREAYEILAANEEHFDLNSFSGQCGLPDKNKKKGGTLGCEIGGNIAKNYIWLR